MNFLCVTWMRPTTHFLCRGATSLPVTTMRKPYSWFQTASCWRRIWPNWIAWRNGFKKSRRKTKHSNQSPAEGHSCPLEKSVVEACCSKWCWKNSDRTQNYGRQTWNACLGPIKVTGDTWVLWDMLEHEWKPSFNQDLRLGWTLVTPGVLVGHVPSISWLSPGKLWRQGTRPLQQGWSSTSCSSTQAHLIHVGHHWWASLQVLQTGKMVIMVT